MPCHVSNALPGSTRSTPTILARRAGAGDPWNRAESRGSAPVGRAGPAERRQLGALPAGPGPAARTRPRSLRGSRASCPGGSSRRRGRALNLAEPESLRRHRSLHGCGAWGTPYRSARGSRAQCRRSGVPKLICFSLAKLCQPKVSRTQRSSSFS